MAAFHTTKSKDIYQGGYMDVKLYVGNLPFSITEEKLQTLFDEAGTVVSVNLIKDRYTGESRGFAFVEMTTQVEAEKAMGMFNGYFLDNRELKVNLARPREDRKRNSYGSKGKGDKRRY
jgi:RNA recognition motif-containing protein